MYFIYSQICEEEALLAVALLPLLSELVIHSNPLTTQRSGKPLVSYFFVIVILKDFYVFSLLLSCFRRPTNVDLVSSRQTGY